MRGWRWRSSLMMAAGLFGGMVAFAPMVRPGVEHGVPRSALVRRADFQSEIVAVGRVQSANSTDILCTLERVGGGVGGTIISLIPDGTMVEEGTVLGELDSSSFRELVRVQTIAVEQARAAQRQAELDLEVAEINLESFRQGEMRQNDRILQSQITLAQSERTRQADRLNWTKQMAKKGYSSLLQIRSEQQSLLQIELTLAQAQRAFRNYQQFTARKESLILESQVNGAKATLGFQTIKLRREEERLVMYQSMVDRCTIRAPHAGLVIHANRPGRAPEVDLGMTVRQRQKLFTLPDLSQMEVQVLLHETIVNRVQLGMPARVHLEALPDVVLQGVVKSIAPLPYQERKSETGSTDVTYFQGVVQLSTAPEGLKPGMTAELEIKTADREGVPVVPHAAVMYEEGRHICRVVHRDGPESKVEVRPVTLGESNHDMQEIIEGVAEGEEVMLDTSAAEPPSRLGAAVAWLWK